MAVFCETMPGPANTEVDVHSPIGWSTGPTMEELEKVPKKLKGSATLQEDQQYELAYTTPAPRTVSLVAYVAEDGLVGHQWEERPLVL